MSSKILLFANTDWYLWNFRRSLAIALKNAGYEVLLLSPPGDYGARFLTLGLRWQSLEMDRRSLHPLRELAVLWRLVRLFRRERPALVHGFTIKCAVYGSVAARMAGVPARVNAIAGMGYVFSSDDLLARWLRGPVRIMLRLTLGGGRARVILQNSDDVTLFERAGLVNFAHIRLIRGSGVDCTHFMPRPCVSNHEHQVLLAARLLWDKGIAEYAEAARMLHDLYPRVRFLLAGTPDPGNPAAVPESVLRGWVREGVLDWLGHVEDMVEVLGSVDVAVLPSYYREGTPKFLIEAAACGLALVTCDVPGCREVVVDGVNGLLVPPRDAKALAAAIAKMLDSGELRKRFGRAARETALAEFDEKMVIESTLALYRELL